MSPFAHFLHGLRKDHQIRQRDLAEMLGYDQSYVSALEVGLKSPPPGEFVEKLITVLSLPADQADKARKAADASNRRLVLDVQAPLDLYRLMDALRSRMNRLHPKQVHMLCDILEMSDSMPARLPVPPRRSVRCKTQQEAPM
ncbi:helix-turn-helix transcriptional regulator [Diaphorobacter sp.]|uniref:helix-turn-helix domain-containing protein n=1 Tax=Diaphorobacter sp. TaxID=1934310 RepID=UPI0028B16BF5|nr:helix-turn-helix transcriptional regulator [Diaphorobacter sp.]